MVFADTSALYALLSKSDSSHEPAVARARDLEREMTQLWSGVHVLQELWLLLDGRVGRERADLELGRTMGALTSVRAVEQTDLEEALVLGRTWSDQDFSLADRISFVQMMRTDTAAVWTYDSDFTIFRFGPNRTKAFTVIS